MMASAIIFRKSGWNGWSYGHEKLVGVILWNFEAQKEKGFKYSRLLKKHACGRTQNYKLLREIVERKILESHGHGYYKFPEKYQKLIDQIFKSIKDFDKLGDPNERQKR